MQFTVVVILSGSFDFLDLFKQFNVLIRIGFKIKL